MYNRTTNPLPAELKKYGTANVNTLLSLGYGEKYIKILLDIADEKNEHPDWSEWTDEEIDDHFLSLVVRYVVGRKKELI